MIYYELKIESANETIEITEENTIYFAEIFLDTLNKCWRVCRLREILSLQLTRA